MNNNIRVLFVSPPHNRGFIKNDLDILQRNYLVKTVYYDYNEVITLLFLIPRIIKGVIWADVVFIWFASFHALFSVLFSLIFRKKTLLVVGGYEVVNEPSINYGLMKSKFTSWIPKFSIRYSNIVLCVSHFSKMEVIKHTKRKDLHLIYNGIDLSRFKLIPGESKQDIILTVGGFNRLTFKKKGISTFIEIAKYLPEFKFVMVGDCDQNFLKEIKKDCPSNLLFAGKVSTSELLEWYRKAKLYCQLSYHESFGVALAEAMACECVPVVTNKGALSEVVGDTGFYVPYGDAQITANTIVDALNSGKGKISRERIANQFSIEERERRIIELL